MDSKAEVEAGKIMPINRLLSKELEAYEHTEECGRKFLSKAYLALVEKAMNK